MLTLKTYHRTSAITTDEADAHRFWEFMDDRLLGDLLDESMVDDGVPIQCISNGVLVDHASIPSLITDLKEAGFKIGA